MLQWRTIILLFLPAALAVAQTRVDLSKQSRNADFSKQSGTKPAQTGTTLPATCSQGEVFFSIGSSVAAGQNLFLCTAADTWTQVTTGGGGGGIGGGTAVTSTSALTDLIVTYSASTPNVLTVGSSCTALAPCNIRFGPNTTSVASPATLTVSSGAGVAGMVYIYLTAGPTLNVFSTVTGSVTCSSIGTPCSVTTGTGGATPFPSDSIPLATWTATAGVWDVAGGTDLRAFISNRSAIRGQTGIVVTDVQGEAIISADPAVVGIRVSAPATSSTACTSGNFAADSAFFYQCVAANTWLRVALATW